MTHKDKFWLYDTGDIIVSEKGKTFIIVYRANTDPEKILANVTNNTIPYYKVRELKSNKIDEWPVLIAQYNIQYMYRVNQVDHTIYL